jgi:4-hydroxybenzoyl-CoA reductase subunit beta
MPRMPAFEWLRATTYAQAAQALASTPGARLLGGGTDLVPALRHGLGPPTLLVDLGAVQARDEFVRDERGLVIGAGVTLARLAAEEQLAGPWAAIAQSAAAVAAPAHRTAATVGGNLCLDTRCIFYNQSDWWRQANDHCLKHGGEVCHVAPQGKRCFAAFSGDLAPALMALDAQAEWLSVRGTRRVALADCYRDDGAAHLTAAPDEVLVRLHVPAPPAGSASAYRKARVRGGIDFPLAGVACALHLAGGALAGLRVALTGTNPQPLLLQGTEALLGRPLDDAGMQALGKLVAKQVSPMRTTVTPANYRRQVAAVLAQRVVRDLVRDVGRDVGRGVADAAPQRVDHTA